MHHHTIKDHIQKVPHSIHPCQASRAAPGAKRGILVSSPSSQNAMLMSFLSNANFVVCLVVLYLAEFDGALCS